MTQSIRERIVQSVINALTPVAQALGATLVRAPTMPIAREQSPALLVIPESDSVVARPNDRLERQLVLRLTALARDQAGKDAHAIADELLVAAHRALFADPGFDALAIGLNEIDCDWQEEDADATLAAMPARYQITYRTRQSDISRQG